MSRPKPPAYRCRSCGRLFIELDSNRTCSICVAQDTPHRTQRYLREVSPVETLGCVTSRLSELAKNDCDNVTIEAPEGTQ
jgi:hypothetical protein